MLFENDIGLVLIVKNESTYIGEWLEYHYKIGVDKFYVYNNESEDRLELEKVLEPWIQKNIVEYFQFPGTLAQIPVYIDAIKKFRFDCKYLGFIDCDEFIVPKNNQELIDILNESIANNLYQPTGSLVINWRMFHSNGKWSREPGGVLERFPKRPPDDFEPNQNIKTIANPRMLSHTWMPHNFVYYPNCRVANDNGHFLQMHLVDHDGLCTTSPKNPENTTNRIQLNHYYVKSYEEYVKKRQRGRSDAKFKTDSNDFFEMVPDTVEDLTAFEIFQRPIVFREKIVNDESTIRDLEFMLSESEHDFEQLLTCFHRASKLKNSEARERYQAESIYKISGNVLKHEAFLFLDSLPELLQCGTRFNSYIITKALVILDLLQQDARIQESFGEYNRYLQMKSFLESIL